MSVKFEIRNSKFEKTGCCVDGFTLIEVLLAMFILALGMVAIASVFPVGGYLQKKAYDEVTTLQITDNLEASVPTRGFFGNSGGTAANDLMLSSILVGVGLNNDGGDGIYDEDPTDGIDNDGNGFTDEDPAEVEVFGLYEQMLDRDPANGFNLPDSIEWPLSMRSFPTGVDVYMPDPTNPPIPGANGIPNEVEDPGQPVAAWADDGEDPLFFRREFYWVPVAQKAVDGKWRIFIFIVRAQGDANYSYRKGGYPDSGISDWWRGNTSSSIFANRADGQENPLEPTSPVETTIWHVPGVRRFELSADPGNIDPITNYPDYATIEINETGVGSGAGNTRPMEDVLQIGDQILGSNGDVYRVVDIPEEDKVTIDRSIADLAELNALRGELNAVWFALPATTGQPSPTTRIVMYGEEAVK